MEMKEQARRKIFSLYNYAEESQMKLNIKFGLQKI